jgi:hypothetical protein
MPMEFIKSKLRWIIVETAEALDSLSRTAIKHITWKESFRILRQSIIPGLIERAIGVLVLLVLFALFGALLQLADVLKGFIGHFR